MKKYRVFAALLALVMLLTLLPVSALAAEGADWLIPPMREYRAFTDTPGTICEEAAATCCRAGLMDGVDSKHFLPSRPQPCTDHRHLRPAPPAAHRRDPGLF